MQARAVDAPIGVYDSGIGGLSVLRALQAEMPGEDYVYFADSAHAPYGERDDAYVVDRALRVTEQLIAEHRVKALVLACNTATAAAVETLRGVYPDLPVIGVEPALKPAMRLTRTGHVGVMATRGTLASARFRALLDACNGKVRFSLQACDGLAEAIERQDTSFLIAASADYTRAMGIFGVDPGQMDTLVLGCTHYPLVAAELQVLVGMQVQLVETGPPVASQCRRVLHAARLLRDSPPARGGLRLLSSGSTANLQAAADRWLAAQVC